MLWLTVRRRQAISCSVAAVKPSGPPSTVSGPASATRMANSGASRGGRPPPVAARRRRDLALERPGIDINFRRIDACCAAAKISWLPPARALTARRAAVTTAGVSNQFLKGTQDMTASNLVPIPELYVSADSAAKLKLEAAELPSWDLTPRQTCDLELLMNGGFHPLKGFLSEADYDGVVKEMRLADGTLWPMPITLDVSQAFADKIEPGQDIALRDQEGVILAIMSVTDLWTPDRLAEARGVFRTEDTAHPTVNFLVNRSGAGLSRRPDHRHPAAGALRLPRPPQHPERAAHLFPQARLAADRRLPDPQPAAPGAPGADLPRRPRGAGEPPHPPVGRHDQARRHRPFHPGALLRGGARPVPGLDHDAVAPQPRHAHGRAARGGVARDDPAATTAART